MSDKTIENEKEVNESKKISNITLHYFSTLKQEKNTLLQYEYKPPIYGESNTDISYYEPNETRIANMRKTASGLSSGVYDFDENSKVSIEDAFSPIGRKPGLTFEEVSQMQTDNNARMKATSDKATDADSKAKENIKEAVEMSKAIADSQKVEVGKTE